MPNLRYVVVGSVVGSTETNLFSVIVSDNAACEVGKFKFACVHVSGTVAPQDPIQIAVIQ